MGWPEIEKAKSEKRRELTLSGPEISKRITEKGLDPDLFQLTDLNYLNISNTPLETIPADIERLKNLQTLVLHSNKLREVELPSCGKLKTLDLSRNHLEALKSDYNKLELVSANFSCNKLTEFVSSSEFLTVLDLSYNRLECFPECRSRNLAELNLSHNQIEVISPHIRELINLKVLNMNNNKLKAIVGEVTKCSKLKDVNFKDNPITDKKLQKLINQGRSKQILDYIKQNSPVRVDTNRNVSVGEGSEKESDGENESLYAITVQHFNDDGLNIVIKDDVKPVRPHIVGFFIYGVTFAEEMLKKFIQLQCKLHDGVCNKRLSATIATHDASKLVRQKQLFLPIENMQIISFNKSPGNLTYTALASKDLKLQPLNRNETLTGAELFARLKAVAEALRKEKKRNTYSGIHKYLHLLDGQAKYPCLLDASERVVSFPPITNSEITKVPTPYRFEYFSFLFSITVDNCNNQRYFRRSDKFHGHRDGEKSSRHSFKRNGVAVRNEPNSEAGESSGRRWEFKICISIENRFDFRR